MKICLTDYSLIVSKKSEPVASSSQKTSGRAADSDVLELKANLFKYNRRHNNMEPITTTAIIVGAGGLVMTAGYNCYASGADIGHAQDNANAQKVKGQQEAYHAAHPERRVNTMPRDYVPGE